MNRKDCLGFVRKCSIFFKKIHRILSEGVLSFINFVLTKNKFVVNCKKRQFKDTNNFLYNLLSIFSVILYAVISIGNTWHFDVTKITESDTLSSKIIFLLTIITVLKCYCETEKKNNNFCKNIFKREMIEHPEWTNPSFELYFYQKISSIYAYICFTAILILFCSIFAALVYDAFFLFKLSKILVTVVYILTAYDTILHIFVDLFEVEPDYKVSFKRGANI